MGYKNFQVVKEIYLPIQRSDNLTLAEYKEKYGIDLKPFVSLDDEGKSIQFTTPNNAKFFIAFLDSLLVPFSKVFQPNAFTTQSWDSGVDSAETILMIEDITATYGIGIAFTIDANDAFDLANIHVGVSEI